MCNRKWAKQPFFHCIVLVHKSLCWQHCFLIKKFWAWDVINRNLWKEKRIYYSKWNPNCVWFVFQPTVLGSLSIFITQCHLDRNINGIPHSSAHCNKSPVLHLSLQEPCTSMRTLIASSCCRRMGNRRCCSGTLEEGNGFPVDASSPKAGKVEFPSAEPLHTGWAGTGNQNTTLKKKNQGSAVSICSDSSSQDAAKENRHVSICPVASPPASIQALGMWAQEKVTGLNNA